MLKLHNMLIAIGAGVFMLGAMIQLIGHLQRRSFRRNPTHAPAGSAKVGR